MAGNGVCQLIAPNLTNYLIKAEGWRTAFVAMGLGWGGVVTVIVLFMLRDRRAPAEAEATASPAEPVTGYTVRQGVRSGSFVRILSAVLICFTVTIGLTVHLVPLLATRGLTQDEAVWVYSSLGISGAVANVVTGYLVDRLPAKPLTAFVVALSAIACLLLLQPSDSLWQRLFATTLFGFAGGGQMPAFAYIATRYFGLRSFGTLFGFVSSAMAIPAALAPYLFGLLYDQSHSYTTMLLICIPVALVASLIVLSLGRYPQFEAVEGTAKAADPLPA
jgi:predicted MFS family arabinose efflux permease